MKTTKLLAVALASLMLVGCANNSSKKGENKTEASSEITKVMKSFDGMEGVNCVEAGGMALGVAKLVLNATPLKDITDDLSKINVLEYDDASDEVQTQINEKIESILSSYELLLAASDDGEGVKIYANMEGEDTIKDLIVFTESDNAVIAVSGSISTDDVAKVVEEAKAQKDTVTVLEER